MKASILALVWAATATTAAALDSCSTDDISNYQTCASKTSKKKCNKKSADGCVWCGNLTSDEIYGADDVTDAEATTDYCLIDLSVVGSAACTVQDEDIGYGCPTPMPTISMAPTPLPTVSSAPTATFAPTTSECTDQVLTDSETCSAETESQSACESLAPDRGECIWCSGTETCALYLTDLSDGCEYTIAGTSITYGAGCDDSATTCNTDDVSAYYACVGESDSESECLAADSQCVWCDEICTDDNGGGTCSAGCAVSLDGGSCAIEGETVGDGCPDYDDDGAWPNLLPAIIGGVVGGLVCLCATIGIIVCFCCKNKKGTNGEAAGTEFTGVKTGEPTVVQATVVNP